MASRLKTRLSAGAALVTGLGMIGIASAAPALAEVAGELEYTCSVPDLNIEFEDPWTVNMTFDVPEQVEQGETIPAGAITATVAPGEDATDKIQALGTTSLEGTSGTSYTFGEGDERTVDLTVPQTDVPTEGGFTVEATGTSTEETAPAEDVMVPIVAGDFTAELANDDDPPFVFKIECDAPADATVANVAVGDAEPDADGEPGDGDNGGGEPGDGDNGAGEPGGEGEPGDGDNGAGEPGGDNGAGDEGPEIPGKVQTDDVAPQSDNAALALGGLLLAGAGAGTVLVARRRQAQH